MPRPGGGECSTRRTSWVGVDGSRWQRRRKQPSLRYGLVIQLAVLEAVAKTFPAGIRAVKWGSPSSSRVIGLNCRSSTRWSTMPAYWSITTSRPLFRSPITRQTENVFRSCTPRITSSSGKTLRGGWNARLQRIFKNWLSGLPTATFAMAAATGVARRAKHTARHWAWTIGYGRQRRSTGFSNETSSSWKTTYDVTLQARRDLSTRRSDRKSTRL